MVAVQAIRLISGDDEVKALAEGLTDAIGDALGHQTALTVRSGDPAGADFVLKGSVQAAGKRLRLSFGLEEGASATQVWTQRYDRQLDDVFGLQDEIVLHVAAAIRIRVKAQLFERLRDADNATLAVPQLLDKAAGIFIRSLDRGGEAVSTLRLAVERAPGEFDGARHAGLRPVPRRRLPAPRPCPTARATRSWRRSTAPSCSIRAAISRAP